MSDNENPPQTDRRDFLQQFGAVAVAGAWRPGALSGKTFLARTGEPQAVIVVGKQGADGYRWIAEELRRYLRLLSGADFPIIDTSELRPQTICIAVGGPESNELTAQVSQEKSVDFSGLKKEGFLLQTTTLHSRPVLIVGGNDEAASLYAVYELIERLGVVFQLTRDIIPETNSDLLLPLLQVKMEPALKYRGLNYRHFSMPLAGLESLKKTIDQLAKMKCNYIEFYWYIGAPWVEFSYRGEKQLIGDLYPNEAGYLGWRRNTMTFTASDVKVGREHFQQERVCAPELQECETPEEAHRAARHLLRQLIKHAHKRKIQVWLGMGDCPGTPPNLGRFAKYSQGNSSTGPVPSYDDAAAVGIWEAAVKSMIETYPEADGYWVWLMEGQFYFDHPEAKKVVQQYEKYRALIPSMEEIRKIWNSPFFNLPDCKIDADIGCLHVAKELIESIKRTHPSSKVGVSLLGRAYLFPAMDAMFPKEVPFQSMESSLVWNRRSRVPMESFGGLGERERLLVPRLDDDESELAMQFNVGLYDHDQVVAGSLQYGVTGIAPQTGKLRGLEQNARFIAEGAWNPSLTPEQFYKKYVQRIFGPKALETMLRAYNLLELNEMFLGLKAEFKNSHFFSGMANFFCYDDTHDIQMMRQFRRQICPFDGPDFEKWNIFRKEASPWVEECRYRYDRFGEGLKNLEKALIYLKGARGMVLPGALEELEYLIFKTENYISHLETVRALLSGYIAYDAAFRAKRSGSSLEMLEQMDECEFLFNRARDLAHKTAEQMKANGDDLTEKFILFHHNVRFVIVLEEFCKFIRNVANFHHGQPYWEEVNWDIIAPPLLVTKVNRSYHYEV